MGATIRTGDRVAYDTDLFPEMSDLGPGWVVDVICDGTVAVVEFDTNRFDRYFRSQVACADLVLVPSRVVIGDRS